MYPLILQNLSQSEITVTDMDMLKSFLNFQVSTDAVSRDTFYVQTYIIALYNPHVTRISACAFVTSSGPAECLANMP